LQQLFEALGQPDKQAEYLQKYKEHGGIWRKKKPICHYAL
jgi:hypothetical protein